MVQDCCLTHAVQLINIRGIFFAQTDLVAATETAAHDVTGGIEAKLQVSVSCISTLRSVFLYLQP